MLRLTYNIGALSEKTTVPNSVKLKPQLIDVPRDLTAYLPLGVSNEPCYSQKTTQDHPARVATLILQLNRARGDVEARDLLCESGKLTGRIVWYMLDDQVTAVPAV